MVNCLPLSDAGVLVKFDICDLRRSKMTIKYKKIKPQCIPMVSKRFPDETHSLKTMTYCLPLSDAGILVKIDNFDLQRSKMTKIIPWCNPMVTKRFLDEKHSLRTMLYCLPLSDGGVFVKFDSFDPACVPHITGKLSQIIMVLWLKRREGKLNTVGN